MTVWIAGSALVVGALVGVVAGLVGAGGNVLLIPALVFLYGMSQKTAQGTSVATMMLPIGAFAFWKYHKAGHVDLKLALVIGIGFAIGGYFGAAWAQGLSDVLLRRAFAVLLVLVAVKLAFTR